MKGLQEFRVLSLLLVSHSPAGTRVISMHSSSCNSPLKRVLGNLSSGLTVTTMP